MVDQQISLKSCAIGCTQDSGRKQIGFYIAARPCAVMSRGLVGSGLVRLTTSNHSWTGNNQLATAVHDDELLDA